jgi:hypothetical protein
MQRVGHRARGFDLAQQWDIEQYRQMTLAERRRIAKVLRDRFWGTNCPDVRDAVAGLRRKRK